VPKLMKSTKGAMRSAVRQARGSSIIVPILYSTLAPSRANTCNKPGVSLQVYVRHRRSSLRIIITIVTMVIIMLLLIIITRLSSTLTS
jgi:hypothetical protein